jgi:hypothetical protein
MIKVEYDGKFPSTCSGTLRITVDDVLVYEESFCCVSTGNVWFDDDWCEHVEQGELIWTNGEQFSDEIRQAVKEKLAEYHVCCGGCV